METIQLFSSLPSTKAEVDMAVNSAVESILSGKRNPLEIAIKLKVMEDIVKMIRANSDVKDLIMDEAERSGQAIANWKSLDSKHEAKTFEFDGAKITIAEVSKYDFSQDAQWSMMTNDLNLKKEILKIRENTLKNMDKEMADPITGEIYTPPTKQIEKQIRINLK